MIINGKITVNGQLEVFKKPILAFLWFQNMEKLRAYRILKHPNG